MTETIIATVVLNGRELPVTNLLDAKKEETRDFSQALVGIAKGADDEWLVFDVAGVTLKALQ